MDNDNDLLIIMYPTYLPSVYKLVDRVCRQLNTEILLDVIDHEGHHLMTGIPRSKYSLVANRLYKYSSLFSIF
jgi:hypothetical protein